MNFGSYDPRRDSRFSYGEYTSQTITNHLPVWKRPEPFKLAHAFGAMVTEVIVEGAVKRAEDFQTFVERKRAKKADRVEVGSHTIRK